MFIREAALSVRDRLWREKALCALTMANARIFDLQHLVGSLQNGKDAHS